MHIESYRDLIVWQKAMDAVVEYDRLAARLPKYEQYGLASQIGRSAASVASNIVEGHARATSREYAHFLAMARGSGKEMETQLHICLRLGYLSPDQTSHAFSLADEVSRMLTAIRASVLAGKRTKSTRRR
ncbi:MAG TPA: four helix bundle protein [Gemmatimonadaceae bacterium]|nr:four helix bundle protein [Gemmatimonadaceae bacterium]